MDKLLKGSEVAERLSVSRSKAYQLMKSNQLPTIKIGKNVRVRNEDLEDYILAHRDLGEICQ